MEEPTSAVEGQTKTSMAWEGRRTGLTKRWPMWLAAVSTATMMVVAVAVVMAQTSTPAPQPSQGEDGLTPLPNSPTEAAKTLTSAGGHIEGYLAGGRWREGSKLVDVPGLFKISGDRVAFYSLDQKSRFACLENLNSERVARIVGESPESLEWSVQGTITEYKSENYLLVTQAVIRSRGGRESRSPNNRAGQP